MKTSEMVTLVTEITTLLRRSWEHRYNPPTGDMHSKTCTAYRRILVLKDGIEQLAKAEAEATKAAVEEHRRKIEKTSDKVRVGTIKMAPETVVETEEGPAKVPVTTVAKTLVEIPPHLQFVDTPDGMRHFRDGKVTRRPGRPKKTEVI